MKKANEIRHDCKSGYGDPVSSEEGARIYFLGEIAAQLAELNENISRLSVNVAVASGQGNPQ